MAKRMPPVNFSCNARLAHMAQKPEPSHTQLLEQLHASRRWPGGAKRGIPNIAVAVVVVKVADVWVNEDEV